MCLAVPGRIETVSGIDPPARVGKVSFGGIRKEVSLAFVPEAQVGDFVIVHVGFAISRLDQEEACRILRFLNEAADMHADTVPIHER